MKFTYFLVPSLSVLTLASPRIQKREVCTVQSLNDPLLDDAPAIIAALKKCGGGDRILLANACDFQINGLIQVSRDWDYWQSQTAVFKIPNTTAAIIRSDGNTGVIDAQYFGRPGPSTIPADRIPKLFSISNESYQIHIRDLKVKNVPGFAFYVDSGSSAVRFYGVDLESASTGYVVDHAQHVYLWNNTIRASNICIAVLPNSTNIQLEESTCIIANSTKASSGMELRLLATNGLGWIRNVFVKKVKAIGSMNFISFANTNGSPGTIEITNATFADITLEGRVERALYLEQRGVLLNATLVAFNNFQGEAEKESSFTCANPGDVCDFKKEGWSVVTKN